MPVKLVYERPDTHQKYSGVKSITMEIDDQRTLEEMQEAFDEFLRAMSYNVPYRDEEDDQPLVFGDYKASDNVLDLSPIVFGDSDNIDLYDASEQILFTGAGGDSVHDSMINLDIADTITLNLDETYGTTTSKLKVD